MRKLIASALFVAVMLAPATSFANSKWNGRSTWENGQHNGAKSTSCNSGHNSGEAADWANYGC